jgi:tetratricopeptide (TPR) repeat protein
LTLRDERASRLWTVVSVAFMPASVVLAVSISYLLLLYSRSSAQAPLAELVSASSTEGRTLQPRLSGGFPWAPFRSVTRGGSSEYDHALVAAIGTTIAKVRGDLSPGSRHAVGVAELLGSKPREAVTSLSAAAEASNDASIWSDLAAAYHETALRYDEPELLSDALAASDRALAIDPQLNEALFNRSLIIERIGLKDDARDAWTRYLAADSTSDWAGEARQHLGALRPEEPFLAILDREYDRVRVDSGAAAALVARDPFGARGMGVMEVLGRWGQAVQRGDERDADRHLTVARQLGAAVSRGGGDRMLERAVSAIDKADPSTRALLAAAHVDYQSGLKAFQATRPVDGESLLRQAASAFKQARSPMVLPARYFAANTVFEQGRHDQAERELEGLLATVPEDFPAYRAMTLWQLGTCHGARADWGTAITLYEQSTSLFDRLGETQNVAAVLRALAFVYERIGDPITASNHRVAALRGLGGRSSLVLDKTVSSIADAAILRREWHVAASFLSIGADIALRINDDMQLANALLMRAVVRDHLKDVSGSRADIAEGKAAVTRVKDPAYRAYLRVAELRASAMLASTPPSEADSLLTEALDFQTSQSDRLYVPGLLLQRARVRRSAGNITGAMADLQKGIAELEQNRRSLPEGEARWGAFHAAEELFDEAVDLAMVTNDADAAFRFAELGRARALLESYGRPPVLDYKRLPAGTVVVEYAVLPSRLIIFAVDSSGVHAAAVECGRETLAGNVDSFSNALREGRPAGTTVATVYHRLIDPIAPQLLGAMTVVFVPGSVTSTVPFSALTDSRGTYLVERYAIVVAPSAAAFVAASKRHQEAPPKTALIIQAGEVTADSGSLAYVDSEARLVAAAYRSVTRVREDAAQFDELTERVPDADVIHFAGHAIGDDRGFEPASIVLRQKGGERRVGVAEIAKLRLRRTSVVVLAGCSTARGERRAAEGVVSVAHGFLSAGAPSVIATLWPIADDAASRFFPRLHTRLAEGISPAEALRAAQLESIHRGDIPTSLWAAVQDIGS